MGDLYIIATPIGNLGDITFRAVETLRSVDLILCEDTRRTSNLLSFYKIEKPLLSYHQHSNDEKIDRIIDSLKEGKSIALVSDAGTPAISDPGGVLVERVVNENIRVIPIPGPSALTAIASVAGFPVDKFVFLGFPPVKKRRKKFFEEVFSFDYPVIIYESTHRILKTMGELAEIDGQREAVIGRELTKKFETIYRGTIDDLSKELKEKSIKGEFVIILR